MPRPAKADGGFTLLEVLIAVVVLGLLVLGLSQGVRTGISLRQAQVQRLTETAELDAAMRLLRGLLARMPVIADAGQVTPGSEPGPPFKGAEDRVSFVGNLPTGLGSIRRADMTLSVHNARLVLAWTPRRHERALGPPPAATETELLQGVERIELAYWKAPSGNEATGWQREWDEPELPQLIRVRVFFPARDRRRWPDLVAAPKP